MRRVQFRNRDSRQWNASGDGLEYVVRALPDGAGYRLSVLDGSTVVCRADAVKRTHLFLWAKCFDADPYVWQVDRTRAERADRLARALGVAVGSYTRGVGRH